MIVKSNDVYRSLSIQGAYDKLPLGFYQVRFSPDVGFFLSEIPPFTLPSKIYGDFDDVKRWIEARKVLKGNMSILLMGMKGSGKSLEAKRFCLEAKKPVIVISDTFTGGGFNSFISNPAFSDSIIFIDEFEKIYSNGRDSDGDPNDEKDSQQHLLSLMDGVFKTKLTFVLTTNKGTESLNENMFNRPGRIRYCKKYNSLPEQIVDDVIEDMLINKVHKSSILRVKDTLSFMTFDILTSLIEEVNIFNEPGDVVASKMCLISEKSYFDIHETFEGIGTFSTVVPIYWNYGSSVNFQRSQEFYNKFRLIQENYHNEEHVSEMMTFVRKTYSLEEIEEILSNRYVGINSKTINWEKVLKQNGQYIFTPEAFSPSVYGVLTDSRHSFRLVPETKYKSENPFVI